VVVGRTQHVLPTTGKFLKNWFLHKYIFFLIFLNKDFFFLFWIDPKKTELQIFKYGYIFSYGWVLFSIAHFGMTVSKKI